ncbi:MAG: hypothetical protein A2284_17020 [Deltaproteobacteria bacterium RIFOXYA12_FULL_61_11]|nr:MAG: hypothetical protein A2284_17020 [Deltaproteobacteria bacterium RIFOXYA12_FULL_61_11]
MNPGENSTLGKHLVEGTELKVMPTVAQRVIQMVNGDTATAEQLERVLIGDPGLTATILRIANSPYYGLPKEIRTISMAIVVLGFKTLRRIVLAAATRNIYTNPGPEEQRLWEHSLGVAIACRECCRKRKLITPDEAFIAGLFHDIGKVIINNLEPRKYRLILTKIAKTGRPFEELAKKLVGLSQQELGSMLIRNWQIDDDIALALSQAATPPVVLTERWQLLLALLHVGEYACQFLGIGYEQPDEQVEVGRYPAMAPLGLSEQELNSLIEEVDKTFAIEKAFFAY